MRSYEIGQRGSFRVTHLLWPDHPSILVVAKHDLDDRNFWRVLVLQRRELRSRGWSTKRASRMNAEALAVDLDDVKNLGNGG